jgi:hypothetical protein
MSCEDPSGWCNWRVCVPWMHSPGRGATSVRMSGDSSNKDTVKHRISFYRLLQSFLASHLARGRTWPSKSITTHVTSPLTRLPQPTHPAASHAIGRRRVKPDSLRGVAMPLSPPRRSSQTSGQSQALNSDNRIRPSRSTHFGISPSLRRTAGTERFAACCAPARPKTPPACARSVGTQSSGYSRWTSCIHGGTGTRHCAARRIRFGPAAATAYGRAERAVASPGGPLDACCCALRPLPSISIVCFLCEPERGQAICIIAGQAAAAIVGYRHKPEAAAIPISAFLVHSTMRNLSHGCEDDFLAARGPPGVHWAAWQGLCSSDWEPGQLLDRACFACVSSHCVQRSSIPRRGGLATFVVTLHDQLDVRRSTCLHSCCHAAPRCRSPGPG